jgi:hypothetical protein
LLNAPFDWTSLGLTRFFLRRTTNNQGRGALMNAALDAGISIVLLFLLSATVTAALSFINLVSEMYGMGRPIAIADILIALRRDTINWHMAWVYVMVGSTLLPSIAHLSLASTALSTWAFRERIDKQLAAILAAKKKSSYLSRKHGATLLTLRDSVGVVVPLCALAIAWGFAFYIVPDGGRMMLACCEFVAQFFGEAVTTI